MKLWPQTIFASCQVTVTGGVPVLQGSNGPVVSVTDAGVGRYTLLLRSPGVPYYAQKSMTCVVSGLSSVFGSGTAELVSATEIEVRLWNAAGAAVDSSFALLALMHSEAGGIAPPPPPTNLLLDDITEDVYAAWSLSDRLKTTHVGPLFRVRRASDNTELDIGYGVDNRVDQAALSAFCAGTTGSVVTAYNQATLDPFDLTADADANEPIIFTGGAIVLEGVALTPAAVWNGLNEFGDTGGSYLRRNDALGLTGNPGIVAWYNYRHNVSGNDKFPWAIGTTAGGQYSSMTSQPNGPTARLSGSTLLDNYNTLWPGRTTWGNVQHIWPPLGTVPDQSIFGNGAPLTPDGFSGASSPNLVNLWTAWGCSTFANASFSADGWMSTLILVAEANPVDDAFFQAWFNARN